MTPAEYKLLRQQLGSLRRAAAILGVHYTTLDRREHGQTIEREAELAIRLATMRARRSTRLRMLRGALRRPE